MRDEQILLLSCPDRPGIVAAMCGAIAAQGANIEEAAQFSDRGRFFMRVALTAAGDLAPPRAGIAVVADALAPPLLSPQLQGPRPYHQAHA